MIRNVGCSQKISSIDYENTLMHIFPIVFPKVQETNNKKMIVRLFQQLDDAALPLLIGLLYRLPQNTKDELLYRGLNAYAPILKDKLNEELQKDKVGCYITVGTISITRQDHFMLEIGQIDVDYQRLVNNEHVSGAIDHHYGQFSPLVKLAANMATVIASNTVERKGIEIIQRDDKRKQLLELVRSILIQYGIRIDVEDIQIIQVKKATEYVVDATQPLKLTEKTESDLIFALAGYLRDNMADTLTVVS